MIKGFLGRLDKNLASRASRVSGSNPEEDEFYWLKALRWCPQELVDLVNSKACRGKEDTYLNVSYTHSQVFIFQEQSCSTIRLPYLSARSWSVSFATRPFRFSVPMAGGLSCFENVLLISVRDAQTFLCPFGQCCKQSGHFQKDRNCASVVGL